jgi:acyl-CoA thioester hydrolase
VDEENHSIEFSGKCPFRWPIRIYYEDSDAGGLVYHANYLRFLERARTERLRALGFELDALQREHGVMFVVRSMELDFLKPARFNEMLWVTAEFEQVRSASLFFRQAVMRGEDEILCEARVRVVSISAETFRPRPVPDFLAERLRDSMGG